MGAGNLFTVHNWWHLALYELEAGRPERALAIYDAEVHHAASLGVPIEMLDASALLWRLRLEDADTGGRFGPLADAWAAKAGDVPWYVFNDLHAVVAARRRRPTRRGRAAMVDRLDAWLPDASGSNTAMTAEIGLPACRSSSRSSRSATTTSSPNCADPARAAPLRWFARPARRPPAHPARSAIRGGQLAWPAP